MKKLIKKKEKKLKRLEKQRMMLAQNSQYWLYLQEKTSDRKKYIVCDIHIREISKEIFKIRAKIKKIKKSIRLLKDYILSKRGEL